MSVKFYLTSNKYNINERMTKNRGKVYDVRFRITTIDGKTINKKLSGYKTKSLANAAYFNFVQEYCEIVKKSPIRQQKADKEVLFVGDLVVQYMATLGNQNKASVIYDKNNIFRIYILPKFKDYPIDKLTKEELTIWQDELWNMTNKKTGTYFSYKYLTKIRCVFHTFLTWVEDRYSFPNYLKSVKKPPKRQPKRKMQFWTQEQFEHFISFVTDETYHALFVFMFYTGRRKGELFALTPKDVFPEKINFDKSLTRKTLTNATYEVVSTKEDKEQIIPVCERVQKEIAKYKGGSPFYFGGEKPLADNSVRREFLKYTELAGLPRIRIHDLRHSFTSMLISLGANVMVVAELIGDDVQQVLKTYGHLTPNDTVKILQKIK